MRQLTINIPDYYINTFMEFFKNIPEATLLSDTKQVLTEEQIQLLEARSSSANDEYLSKEQSIVRLKNKLSEKI